MMQNEKTMTVLLSPRVSEKSTRIADKHGQFTFKVVKTATKRDIKVAIENLFKVKVREVRTVNVKGKTRRFGKIEGATKDWKKAYVSLEKGFDIDFAGVE